MTDDTIVERMAAEIGRHGWKWAFGEMVGECECGATKFPDTNEPMHAHIATALLPLVREAQAEAVTAFIAEADKSPAITWTGKGGVKELATTRAATYRTGDDHAR